MKSHDGMILTGETEELIEKPVPMSFIHHKSMDKLTVANHTPALYL
jgi:hypothetical protein